MPKFSRSNMTDTMSNYNNYFVFILILRKLLFQNVIGVNYNHLQNILDSYFQSMWDESITMYIFSIYGSTYLCFGFLMESNDNSVLYFGRWFGWFQLTIREEPWLGLLVATYLSVVGNISLINVLSIELSLKLLAHYYYFFGPHWRWKKWKPNPWPDLSVSVMVVRPTQCLLLCLAWITRNNFPDFIHFIFDFYIPQLVFDQVPSLDLKRTFLFTFLGLVLVGPTLHFW